MPGLNADGIRAGLDADTLNRLVQLDVFAEIDSTNSHLMQQSGPAAGKLRVAVTDNQTAGRGQRGRRWQSPPGSGVCLSLAYTYPKQSERLSSLTLAMGIAVTTALDEIGVGGVGIKWPNDLVANDGKLGGILTEAQQQSTGAVTIVTGVGLNLALPEAIETDEGSSWARRIVDLKSLSEAIPAPEAIVAALINAMTRAFADFEDGGFRLYADRWTRRDWLFGRRISVDAVGERVTGIAAGVAEDGALLIATESAGTRQVTSGSVIKAGPREIAG